MSSWLMTPEPRPAARLKLFCVPHAGRGASLFMPWRTSLPHWIEMTAVQFPGRERRFAEPPLRRISIMVDTLASELMPRLDRPYILFGHSMGALICYETARALRRRGAPTPRALVLSGRRAPTLDDDNPPIHALSDQEFIAEMCARYNGIPQIILDQPDMMRMLLPVMRSDIEALETYRHAPEPPLSMPFFIYGGLEDPQVAPDKIAGWQSLTSRRTSTRLFAGGHFYLQDDREPLIEALIGDIAALGAGDSSGRQVNAGRR